GDLLYRGAGAAPDRPRRETSWVEQFEALAADAFEVIVAGGGRRRSRSPDLGLAADGAACLRGHGHAGEVAKIVGGGPIPVSVIEALSENAFYKVVLHDGTQV